MNTGVDTNSSTERTDVCGEFLVSPSEREAIKLDVCEFIDTVVKNAGAEGVIVPMSGGIDSTLTAALAVEALGRDHVLGIGLPALKGDSCHMSDARTAADGLGIEFREIQLQPVLNIFEEAVVPTISPESDTAAIGNVIARLRMCCAYYAANVESRLVCGTANRSELLLGYFTKYGDGGADLYPLGDLYKTEVRSLAHHVDLPRRIIKKDPTAGLQAGQTDADELGATYDVIDPLLQQIIDDEMTVGETASALAIDIDTVNQIISMCVETLHKRAVPPTPGIGGRSDDRPSYSLRLAEQLRQQSITEN